LPHRSLSPKKRIKPGIAAPWQVEQVELKLDIGQVLIPVASDIAYQGV
jgi:hypothetical protein